MWPKFGVKKQVEGWLALVRAGECLDLVHLRRPADGRPCIESCDSFAIESGEADALRRLVPGRGLKRFQAVTLLQDDEYRLLQIEAPAVPEAEWVDAVRWRLKDAVDFPVENAVVAVLAIPNQGGRQTNVFAVVAASTVIGQRMAKFAAAKATLAAIDIPEMALRNVAVLFEETNRGVALLAVQGRDSVLIVTYGGELYLARRIDVSAASLAGADAERQRQMLERLALELQRTLDNFDRQYGFVSIASLVIASEHDTAGVTAALRENLPVPVREIDLAQVIDFPALPELRQAERQARSLLAIGASLRTGA